MSLVPSLLTAIVRADGDALVLHAGERPYVVSPSGHTELASRALTLDAMKGMLAELLPGDARDTLDEVGAVQHEVASPGFDTSETFLVVAARGGEDLWIEIRRRRERTENSGTVEAATSEPEQGPSEPGTRSSEPASVLQLARGHVRTEQAARFTQAVPTAGVDRLLRIAAARGASKLYLTPQAPPLVRVDGEMIEIDGEPELGEAEVESLVLGVVNERLARVPHAPGDRDAAEWIGEVPDIGRVRCLTFRDCRGMGAIFRLLPARAFTAEQLGLSNHIQRLCAETEGLVLVTGPRDSGKSAVISAFVDLINRTRSVHVIALESEIGVVHEHRGSLVSQREVRGDRGEWLRAARAALRENPDVVVIDELASPDLVALAIEAARSGRLVIGALTAHTAADAVGRIIEQAQPERRAQVQTVLACALRGVVAQVLLRKTGGGRLAAREVLLNTGTVASLIAEGKTSQLPVAIESGRTLGMASLNDALVAFVQGGVVDSREAYRHAPDRQGYLSLLRRQGIDTSFVERLA